MPVCEQDTPGSPASFSLSEEEDDDDDCPIVCTDLQVLDGELIVEGVSAAQGSPVEQLLRREGVVRSTFALPIRTCALIIS